MKTKNLFIAGVLAFAGSAFGQTNSAVESTTGTAYGLLNGALSSVENGSTYFGYETGKFADNLASVSNTFIGHQAGVGRIRSFTGGYNNTFLGFQAGMNYGTGHSNTFLGYKSGSSNSVGYENNFIGFQSGYSNLQSSYNIFIGNGSGYSHNSLYGQNVFIGHGTGGGNVDGYGNVMLGSNAGIASSGSQNVYLGTLTGRNSAGSKNVFIGFEAGKNEMASNRLYIQNDTINPPIIYGEFDNRRLILSSQVSITSDTDQANLFPTMAAGIATSKYMLFVKGGILSEEVRVTLKSGWADYVFANDYKLATLPEVEKYIAANGHLPNVPSAKQVKEDGIELGDMARIQQEKIEELTLYAIQQDKQLTEQDQKMEQQQKEIDELKAAVKALMAKK